MFVQVKLEIRLNGLSIKSYMYDGSKEACGDPTLKELEAYIRLKAFPQIFDGFRIRITLLAGDKVEVLRGDQDDATLTQLGVPRSGAVLVISKVFLLTDFSFGFLFWFWLRVLLEINTVVYENSTGSTNLELNA